MFGANFFGQPYFGEVAGIPDVRADAGEASAVGTALDAHVDVRVSASADVASATGSANRVSGIGRASAGVASGTGVASDALGRADVFRVANADAALGVGTASTPAGALRALTSAASGVGAAYGATPIFGVFATVGVASATGAALASLGTVQPSAGLASAIGTARNATPLVPGSQALPSEAIGAANGALIALQVFAGLASATGAALSPSLTIDSAVVTAAAGVASGVGTAHNAPAATVPGAGAGFPDLDLIWRKPNRALVPFASENYKFELKVAAAATPTTTIFTKTDGFSGADTAPNLTVEWGAEIQTLDPGSYVGTIVATRLADDRPRDFPVRFEVRLRAGG